MKIKSIYLILVCSTLLFSCGSQDSRNDQDKNIEGDSTETLSQQVKDSLRFPIDMALIYHGGSGRNAWTQDQLSPYVYREKDGELEWLFDGYLFLEIFTQTNEISYSFVVDRNPANKLEWQRLLTRSFNSDTGPDALNQLLDNLSEEGHVPPYRRKVVISIPNPVYGDENWGSLDNKKLDFNNLEDRMTAATWYVEQVLEIWEKENYEHLQLAGFYWVSESVRSDSDAEVLQAMSSYLDEKDYDFYTIPFYRSQRAEDWKELGFDIAYQQPNYFFDLDTPYSTLTGALDFAREHEMTLEMEFDGRLISQEAYMKRFYDYLNEFEKEGVWDDKPVAYYEGGGAWLQMSQSQDPEVKKAYDALGDILAKRKKKGVQPFDSE